MKLGPYHRAERRRRTAIATTKVMGAALGIGTCVGFVSAIDWNVASTIYYSRCAEARAAGAAPLYLGEPGYRSQLDRDGDGIACEPYRTI